MGFYEQQVLPRFIDLALGSKAMGKLRRRALTGLEGTVVEIGFGSGMNLPHYPQAVERVYAIEPALVRGASRPSELRRRRSPSSS